MLRAILFLILINATFLQKAKTQSNAWAEKIEAVELKNVQILEDKDDNIIIAGSFKDSLLLIGEETNYIGGNGPTNLFIAKYDSNRMLTEYKQYHTSYEFSINILQNLEQDDEGNIYLTGSFYQDLSTAAGDTLLYTLASIDPYISKFDTALNLRWIHRYGGSNNVDFLNDINIQTDGSILISGKMTRTFDYDLKGSDPKVIVHNGGGSPFVALYDKDRNLQWAEILETSGKDITLASVMNSQQDIYSVGINSDTTVVEISGNRIAELTRGSDDIIVNKRSISGELLWVKTMGGAGKEYVSNMEIDNDGNIYILGQTESPEFVYDDKSISTSSGRELLLMKLDADGDVIWLNQFPKAGFSRNELRIFIQNGRLILTGDYESTMNLNSQGEDIDVDLIAGFDFEASYDLDGNLLSAQTIGNGAIRQRHDIRLQKENAWIVSAPIFSTSIFNPLPGGSLSKGELASWSLSKFCAPQDVDHLISYICAGDSTQIQIDPNVQSAKLYAPAQDELIEIDGSIALPKTNTSYILATVDESGCTNYTDINLSIIECMTTNVEEYGKGVMAVFPNPTTAQVNITWPEDMQVEDVAIFDLMGHTIFKETIDDRDHNLSFNLEELIAGSYILRLSGKSFAITELINKY